jgi:nucleoid DNA-binding protein
MAKKTSKKTPAKKVAAAKAPMKPIKEALNKSGLVAHLADASGTEAKTVKKVLVALEDTIAASLSKKGAGGFVLPGLLKISVVKVPAKPKRKGINPFTKEEQWFAAKPASVKIKVRSLSKLKRAAA